MTQRSSGPLTVMAETKVIHPKHVNDPLYRLIGGVALLLNKCRHTFEGYKNPRTFSADQIQRSVEYDFKIVGRWQGDLAEYPGDPSPLKGKRILELGPGPDLGNGLILPAAGPNSITRLMCTTLHIPPRMNSTRNCSPAWMLVVRGSIATV